MFELSQQKNQNINITLKFTYNMKNNIITKSTKWFDVYIMTKVRIFIFLEKFWSLVLQRAIQISHKETLQ